MSIEVKIVSSMLSPKLSSTKIFQTRLVSVEQRITWDGNYKFREWPSCSISVYRRYRNTIRNS